MKHALSGSWSCMTYALRQTPIMETMSTKLLSIKQANSWDSSINARLMPSWPGVMACRTEQRGKQVKHIRSWHKLGLGIAERIHMDLS